MKTTQADLLKRAVLRRMGQLNHIGESKREERARKNAALRAAAQTAGRPTPAFQPSSYIHSIATMKQYTEICLHYAAWLAEVHPKTCKLAQAHKLGYDHDYVQAQIDRGLSAWTVNRTCSALAKMNGCTAPEVHSARPARKRAAIKRGRGYSQAQYRKDRQQYGEMVELCRATGVRRAELLTLTPEDFRLGEDGCLLLRLDGKKNNTKGGRSRTVEILPRHQKRVAAIIGAFSLGEVIFPKVPKRLNVHGIRALYAQDFYKAMTQPPARLKGQRITDHRGRSQPAVYHCRDGANTPRRVYDRAALFRVSQSLGHNRCDVVATYYLK